MSMGHLARYLIDSDEICSRPECERTVEWEVMLESRFDVLGLPSDDVKTIKVCAACYGNHYRVPDASIGNSQDCRTLGCGPQFCDWPHCKTAPGVVIETRQQNERAKREAAALGWARSPIMGHVFTGPSRRLYDDPGLTRERGFIQIASPDNHELPGPLAHYDASEGVWRRLIDGALDGMTISDDAPETPPEPPSLHGPDRGE